MERHRCPVCHRQCRALPMRGPKAWGPAVKAPEGYVWRWNGKSTVTAHLVKVHPPPRHQRFISVCIAPCTRIARGRVRAAAVGGYSARPCPDCLEATS